ncbi:protocatechuate 3,4-dioxygenase alpha subunit [Limimaricola soesokkakensis]|uniref:Protocatechuate 3,4-dioxygenase alpha chain n=1 Tax=Limimaricola soesokkakensis TaxID=1343159 RepID=A0A1X7A679_9RHOB|nr:protocatechuate 3,4-dioxygenase subunit alpha [Limimaricola soesokkakensis]PSK80541.1 protocatechuate 3,4-dioxygenase alpha subunit [Limimaricola soesokkakensis]SLN71210.1 Protocatechuate 3,4-dioxygenase alpha chain [Limimaricola soesokkakensis]
MQRIERLKESPSQTAGPYVHIGALPNFAGIDGVYDEDLGQRMVLGAVRGEQITLRGTVYDGTGAALRDAMVEIWQADAAGLYAGQDGADPAFTGWGRQAGDMETGAFAFETVKPGAVPFRDGRMQAPHVSVWIVARGINLGLQTRIYFADEQEANAADPILARIEHRDRISTLMARPEGDGTYRFDIRLQGEAETIFFDI